MRSPFLTALLGVAVSCGGGAGDPDATVVPDAGPRPGDVTGLMTFGDLDADRGQAIAVDGDGNVIVTGFFAGRADLGDGVVSSAGGLDAFLVKQTPEGTPIWERALGDWWTGGNALAVNAAGDIAVAGFFWDDLVVGTTVLPAQGERTAFVARYDAAGSPVWARAIGDADPAWAQSVAIDIDGNVYLGGDFEGTADLGGGAVTAVGSTDAFVVRFAGTDGAYSWSRVFGTSGGESTEGLAVTAGGSPVAVGGLGNDFDFGCGVHDYQQEEDAYIVRLSASDGTCEWSRPIASNGRDSAHAVTIDGADDVVVVGNFVGVVDFGGGVVSGGDGDPALYMVKYAAADGAFRWLHRVNGPSYETPWGVTTDQDDNIYITGTYEETINFGGGARRGQPGGDTYVVAFDAEAGYLWSAFPSCLGVDFGNGIAADIRTGVTVTGAFQDAITAGTFNAQSAGQEDVFIMRLRSQ